MFHVLVKQVKCYSKAVQADEKAVAALDRAWNAAYRTGQRERLREILAKDWLGVFPSGETLTREKLINAAPPPGAKIEQTFSEFSLHLFGDTAVTRGRVDVRVGDEHIRQRFMRVYAKRGERWWAVAVQVIPISEEKEER